MHSDQIAYTGKLSFGRELQAFSRRCPKTPGYRLSPISGSVSCQCGGVVLTALIIPATVTAK